MSSIRNPIFSLLRSRFDSLCKPRKWHFATGADRRRRRTLWPYCDRCTSATCPRVRKRSSARKKDKMGYQVANCYIRAPMSIWLSNKASSAVMRTVAHLDIEHISHEFHRAQTRFRTQRIISRVAVYDNSCKILVN